MSIEGRELILDRQHVLRMLVDSAFYACCPCFLWLRATALKTFAAYDVPGPNDCRGCGPDFRKMQPVVDAFFTNLKELWELNPDLVTCVRRYLEVQKRYPIAVVKIRYRCREGSQIQSRWFQF